jgi:hypothetical protein
VSRMSGRRRKRAASELPNSATRGFRSLLVPIDKPPLSDRVLGRVALLPVAEASELTLLHVVPDRLPLDDDMHQYPQHLRNSLAYLDVPTLGQPEAFIRVKDGLFDSSGGIGPDSREFLQGWMDRYVDWVKRHPNEQS